jgi:hypothetical protein
VYKVNIHINCYTSRYFLTLGTSVMKDNSKAYGFFKKRARRIASKGIPNPLCRMVSIALIIPPHRTFSLCGTIINERESGERKN